MDNQIDAPIHKRERITSIDALRAVTLFGIIIVHACGGFGLKTNLCNSSLDGLIYWLDKLLLVGKCNEIFAALFGVSFYLILRNPNNSSAKFVWRCFLLALIGLFNKLFYTQDVLMWYGLCGMTLVLFRSIKPKYLITISICMLIAHFFLVAPLQIGTRLFGEAHPDRYGVSKSFFEVITYPYAVVDRLRLQLNWGLFYTPGMFLFGYWIAKIGFIEHSKERLSKCLLLMIWGIFIISVFADYMCQEFNLYIYVISSFSGSAAYASAVLYAYYHCEWCNRILRKLEPYGRLGLTNYSMGGIIGVICINEFGLGLWKYGLTTIVLFFIGFYILQAVFSYYWLRYFTYGPFEYVWRVATERKRIPFLRSRQLLG